jgi:hypothetical protein
MAENWLRAAGRRMYLGKYIFSQVMDHLHRRGPHFLAIFNRRSTRPQR